MPKTVKTVNRTVKVVICALLVTASFTLAGCMPPQTNAQNRLRGALNPDDGSYPMADELKAMFSADNATIGDKLKGATCIVDLPLTNSDTMPNDSVGYVDANSGSIMSFHFDAEKDNLPNTLGKVFFEWREHVWSIANGSADNPEYDTCYVESRGKGVYTLYHYEKQYKADRLLTDSLGNPIMTPERLGMLLFVYPGADSILIQRGSEESKRVYRCSR